MMKAILDYVQRVKAFQDLPTGRVLEVGSLDVNGSPRPVFHDATEYVGVDLTAGNGVDVVGDAEHLDQLLGPRVFDSVLCFECLEHTVRPWVIVEHMKRLLCRGGHLWVSTPTFGFPLHRYPVDCYRFGEDAYRRWLFADMDLLALNCVADELGQPALVGVGRRRPPPLAFLPPAPPAR